MNTPTNPNSEPTSETEVTEPTGGGKAAAYKIRVAEFEGPLDLLLHLVRINEVDILDIPIVEITSQYHEYLEMMKELNLDLAGG